MKRPVVFIIKQFLLFLTLMIVVGLAMAIIFFPQPVFQAALRGLNAWLEIVIPALLPFFIISQLFISLGIVHFLGVLLEPIMRPLFNVPGNGAFVMAMGYTSGAPISAMITAQLRQKQMITRVEGERLICFTNNASPLFMLGAVAVGMLHNPALGPILACAHYSANFCLGILLRFYGKNDLNSPSTSYSLLTLPKRAWQSMILAQQKNIRPLGQLLGDAVSQSFQTLITIGGFIILFSVIIQVVDTLGLLKTIAKFFQFICIPLGLNPDSCIALAGGLFEMTMGTKFISETAIPLRQQMVAISLIMGWAGLSIIGQVAAMISKTDLRLGPFIISRIFHGFLAAIIVQFLQGPAKPVIMMLPHSRMVSSSYLSLWLQYIGFPLFIMIIFIIIGVITLITNRFIYRRP
ncbi:MAG: hypothetical protein PWP31_1033 [Clostridia bacterium]|nr:hypothetical protein [Clostridia bacterium]